MKKLNYLLAFILLTASITAQNKKAKVKPEAPIKLKHETKLKAEKPLELNYTTELVVPGLEKPWSMVFLPDNSMLITERSGELIHFKNGTKTSIKGVPEVYVRGQGGLLDIELHPDYKTNGWIYLTYASEMGSGEGGSTALSRAKIKKNKLVKTELLYKGDINTKKGQHFGSRIEFDNDGYLYFSMGERGNRNENPQDITRDGGKIYRFNDDGSIPSDNPFVNVPNAKKGIYSYGHRNPQGMMKHPVTGAIWINEHGPQGGDEINIIEKGKNYGWPVISYGINYDGTTFTDITEKEGMEQPIFYWVPSIAPNGMEYITSDKYPEWKGSILVGSLKFKYIERFVIEDNKVLKREKLFEKIGRVRKIVQGPDGYLYVAAEGKGIYKIVPKK